MTRALWMLIGLQLKGWGRYFVRNLRTIKGALFALVGLLVFAFWISSILFTPAARGLPAETIRANGPAILLIYCLLNVLLSTGEKGIYFSPAEVNFLFSGPFSRRQVLAYKLLITFFLGLPTTLLLALIFRLHSTSFLAAYLGLLLMFLFISHLSVALNLIAMTVGANLYSRVRRVVIIGLLVLVGGYVLSNSANILSDLSPSTILERLNESVVWRVVTWPLRSFFEVFLAERFWPDMVLWSLPGLLANAVLVGIVFWLDANYLETAATASERIYNRLQKIRAGNLFATDESKGGKVRFSLPLPPYWGGIGPILWRQLTTAQRGLARMVFLFVIFGLCMIVPVVGSMGERGSTGVILGLVGGLTLWLTIMLTTLVPFDFRGDIDRMDVLKALPISAWRLTVGQLLTPTLLLSVLQWIILGAVLAILVVRPLVEGGEVMAAGELRGAVLALGVAALVVFPFNFLLFGLENLLFLLFPTRIMGNQPGDFQAIGRNVLLVLAKMFGLVIVGGLAALVGGLCYFFSGQQAVAGLVAAWGVLVCSAAALIPLVALAFQMFDVTRDTPA